MTGQEMEQCDVPDKLTMLSYLSQIYDTFRGEIPHIKHPKLVRGWTSIVFVFHLKNFVLLQVCKSVLFATCRKIQNWRRTIPLRRGQHSYTVLLQHTKSLFWVTSRHSTTIHVLYTFVRQLELVHQRLLQGREKWICSVDSAKEGVLIRTE